MFFEGDMRSNLIKKVQNDLSKICFNSIEHTEIDSRLKNLVSRCSDQRVSGCSVVGITPFSREEEFFYFELYVCVRHEMVSCSDESKFSSWHNSFCQIRTILIYQYMPMAKSWAAKSIREKKNRFGHFKFSSLSESIAEANNVLVNCVDKFNPFRNIRFGTYLNESMFNSELKDIRDNKKHRVLIEDANFLISNSLPAKNSAEDSHAITEVKNIWDGINGNGSSVNFLTDIERAIVAKDFSEDSVGCSQEFKANSLNINIETYKKKKRSALAKIKDAIVSRINMH